MALPLLYDPDDAFVYLDALFDSNNTLYGRVFDLLEAIKADPINPGLPRRPHALRDKDGDPISALTVRSGDEETLVIWGVRNDADGAFIKVSYIGDNLLGL